MSVARRGGRARSGSKVARPTLFLRVVATRLHERAKADVFLSPPVHHATSIACSGSKVTVHFLNGRTIMLHDLAAFDLERRRDEVDVVVGERLGRQVHGGRELVPASTSQHLVSVGRQEPTGLTL